MKLKVKDLREWKKGESRYFKTWVSEKHLSFFGILKYSDELFFASQYEIESRPVTVRLKKWAISFNREVLNFTSSELTAPQVQAAVNAAKDEMTPAEWARLAKRFMLESQKLLEIGVDKDWRFHKYEQGKLF